MTARRLRALLVLGVALCFFAAVPLAGHASPPGYTQYVILDSTNSYTDTVEAGATISQPGLGNSGLPGEGPIAGSGLVFACGTPDVANFSQTTSVLGGLLDSPVPPCITRPRDIALFDVQFTAKVTLSGNAYGIDFLSWASDGRGCFDADAGVSCAAAGGRTSYNRQPSDSMPGDLDPTFGTGGKVTTAIGVSGASGLDVAVQSDGRIVAVGVCGEFLTSEFCLARYNSDGSLDTAFDSDGKVTTDVGTGRDTATAVAVQSDGKIVAAGYCKVNDDVYDFCLARYTSNGSLDTSFDSDGRVTNDFGFNLAFTLDIALQADGKIVAVGRCGFGDGLNSFCLARFNSNGSLDTSFDTDGLLTTVGAGGGFAVAVQGDGKILAAGGCDVLCLTRYNSNGSLDTSFDSDGKATTVADSDIAVQSDGKIVVAGVCNVSGVFGDADFCLARHNGNGSLDTSFDGDGTLTTAIGVGSDSARAVSVQNDGRIVAAGGCSSGAPFVSTTDFCLVRYNVNGSLDTTFDSDGKVTTDFGADNDNAQAVAVQSDGKIVATGGCTIGSAGVFCLARYGADGTTNQVPVGANDSYAVAQGNPLNVVAANGVLANDSDPDAGTILTAVLVAGPANGALTLNANGSFSYTPNATFSGTDTFTYQASDGSLTSSVVTVTIIVSSTASQIGGLAGVTSGQRSSLQDKLARAQAFFNSGKLSPACGKLDEFIAQVNSLTPAKITPAMSAVLINSANALKTYYGCPA